jgi:hypothetical protein
MDNFLSHSLDRQPSTALSPWEVSAAGPSISPLLPRQLIRFSPFALLFSGESRSSSLLPPFHHSLASAPSPYLTTTLADLTPLSPLLTGVVGTPIVTLSRARPPSTVVLTAKDRRRGVQKHQPNQSTSHQN